MSAGVSVRSTGNLGSSPREGVGEFTNQQRTHEDAVTLESHRLYKKWDIHTGKNGWYTGT